MYCSCISQPRPSSCCMLAVHCITYGVGNSSGYVITCKPVWNGWFVGGVNGCGNGFPGVVPPTHGFVRFSGAVVAVFVTRVANGGFCVVSVEAKKFVSSYTRPAPARNTVLPSPTGSNVTPSRGANCHG